MSQPQRSPRRVLDNPSEASCSFGGRDRSITGPMAEGPAGVYICVNCVVVASRIAEEIVRDERAGLEPHVVFRKA